MDILSFRFHKSIGLFQVHLFPSHQKGNRKTGASGYASCAMKHDISLLGDHLTHPSIMIFKQMLDCLLRIVSYLVDFILELVVIFEFGNQITTADTYRCDAFLINNIPCSCGVFITQEDSFLNLINFWRQIAPNILIMDLQFLFNLHARTAHGNILINFYKVFWWLAFIAY